MKRAILIAITVASAVTVLTAIVTTFFVIAETMPELAVVLAAMIFLNAAVWYFLVVKYYRLYGTAAS